MSATVEDCISVGALHIDLPARYVRLDGEPVELTKMEYRLLVALAKEPTRVLTREQLLQYVWGYPADARTRTVDSHAMRLRAKIGREFVINVWGVGYRLTNPS